MAAALGSGSRRLPNSAAFSLALSDYHTGSHHREVNQTRHPGNGASRTYRRRTPGGLRALPHHMALPLGGRASEADRTGARQVLENPALLGRPLQKGRHPDLCSKAPLRPRQASHERGVESSRRSPVAARATATSLLHPPAGLWEAQSRGCPCRATTRYSRWRAPSTRRWRRFRGRARRPTSRSTTSWSASRPQGRTRSGRQTTNTSRSGSLTGRTRRKKPWLTAILDDHSRAICGYYLGFEAPSSQRTALALRQAIWRKGEPDWPVCGIRWFIARAQSVEGVEGFLRHHTIRVRGYIHHNATTTPWRLTAFGGGSRGSVTSKNRLDTVHRHRRR